MIKFLDKYLVKISPALHKRLKKWLNNYRKKSYPKLTREEFVAILKEDLQIKPGDTLFIHSSMRKMYLDFPKKDIFPIIQELVGEEGTLLFPCWQFNTRAEEYILENEIVFSHADSPSAMGKLSDVLRSSPKAHRSFHPTNSVVAIGRHARDLTDGHDQDIYPCGTSSPFYKMIKHNAKVVGLGVTVDNLTFVHCIEDVIKEKFPIKTRMDEVFDCTCINAEGEKVVVKTKVATKAVSKRDVTAFFDKNIPQDICTRISKKRMNFFSGETTKLYESIENCSQKGATIYL